jgi:putative endonuclease
MGWFDRVRRALGLATPTTGELGERLAAEHLEAAGYRIVARNLRLRHGEIDLIADPPGRHAWVVVEVKCSDDPHDAYPPHLRVNRRKQRKLVALAAAVLRRRRLDRRPVRFDIVSVVLHGNAAPAVRHIPAAFEANL